MSKPTAGSLLLIATLTFGCAGHRAAAPRPIMVATRTAAPVQIDGELREPVWRLAATYPLGQRGTSTQESGRVQVAWDESALYLAVHFEDSDVVAEGEKDQLHHYQMGDVVELFLRPADSTWYWEKYATPHGRKTEFFFPGRGSLPLPSCFAEDQRRNMRVAATVDGSLNDWHDRDRGWTAEIAVPVEDLAELGDRFGPGSKWHLLVARYNYSRYLDHRELSSAPILPELNFHLLEGYAEIEFK